MVVSASFQAVIAPAATAFAPAGVMQIRLLQPTRFLKMPTSEPTIIGNATLYTFSARHSTGLIQVVRLNSSLPDDWHEWPDRYSKRHPNIGELLEIAAVELVDERTGYRGNGLDRKSLFFKTGADERNAQCFKGKIWQL